MDNINSPPPPEVPTSILSKKVLKLNSLLESLNLITSSRCFGIVCKKEKDSDVMLVELIKNNDCLSNEELEEDDDVLEEEEFGGDHFDKFPTRSELSYHNLVIDPRMSPVILGKPFIELSNMTYDLSLGIVKFTNEIEEVAYKMPHKIEQYDSLSDVFRRMVEFLGAIPINLKSNMLESEDLIESLINWDKPPINGDRAWHAKIRLIDPDEEEFTKTLQSIPTTRKLSEREVQGKSLTCTTFTTPRV
nr:retrotransposon Orf1 [Tanacetum cinerariifolium]